MLEAKEIANQELVFLVKLVTSMKLYIHQCTTPTYSLCKIQVKVLLTPKLTSYTSIVFNFYLFTFMFRRLISC